MQAEHHPPPSTPQQPPGWNPVTGMSGWDPRLGPPGWSPQTPYTPPQPPLVQHARGLSPYGMPARHSWEMIRTQEYTADNHGYCNRHMGAPGAMRVLAAGKYLNVLVDINAMADRAPLEKGLFIWVANAMSSHPVLTWRIWALRDRSGHGKLFLRPTTPNPLQHNGTHLPGYLPPAQHIEIPSNPPTIEPPLPHRASPGRTIATAERRTGRTERRCAPRSFSRRPGPRCGSA